MISIGHSHGGVSFWTPNFGKPVVQILCHPASSVNTISFTKSGNHFVTTGSDCKMKVWDMRTFKELYQYYTPAPVTSASISQTGLLSVGFEDTV